MIAQVAVPGPLDHSSFPSGTFDNTTRAAHFLEAHTSKFWMSDTSLQMKDFVSFKKRILAIGSGIEADAFSLIEKA